MALVRLSKYLCECGIASRRKVDELIVANKVKVNNRIVSDPALKLDVDSDEVRVRNKLVRPPKKGVVLFHKPRSVLSTLSDPTGRRTVGDYLPREERKFFPVGRLDWDTSGLIILTNDGELANHLMHPRYGFERVYHARVRGSIDEKTVRRLARGVKLEDGVARAAVTIIGTDGKSTWLEIQVREGRNRLVRRMMEKIHHPVLKLKRVSHGPFRLGKLKVGEMQRLSDEAYERYKKVVLAGKSKGARRFEGTKPGAQRRNSPQKSPGNAGRRPGPLS
jgi:23S rRNA pseudouridine2605 synthase